MKVDDYFRKGGLSINIMKIPFVDWFLDLLGDDLPSMTRMDEYMEYILPLIVSYSDDISDSTSFAAKDWLEVMEEEHYLEAIYHTYDVSVHQLDPRISIEDQEKVYQRSVEGNILVGTWDSFNEPTPTLSIKTISRNDEYEIVFVNADFFILKKGAVKDQKGDRLYVLMGNEDLIQDLVWLEVMELLYNIYRYRSRFLIFVGAIVFFIVLVLIFSVF